MFPCRGLFVFDYFAALRAYRFAARRSLGRLRGARQGGAGYGAAPPSRPPLHPPRSTPQEGFQLPQKGEGDASFAPGASLPRSARSGDLPPRRVMPNSAFALNRTPFQPDTFGFLQFEGSAL